MPKHAAPFEVACPCCGAALKIDPEVKAVIAHTPKAVPKTFEDLEAAARAMKDQDSRKESLSASRWKPRRTRATCWRRSFSSSSR